MKENINMSLAEQLAINDREIAYRKNLLEFQDYEVQFLTKTKPYITKQIDIIVSTFYEKQVDNSEISLLIGDSETLARLKGAMRRYILELFDGEYGANYVNRRLRIGKVHKRIGVPPKLYISAIWLLEKTLHDEINKADITDVNELDKPKIKLAVNKLLMLDTQFVFDTYISSLVNEVETAREELQSYTTSLEELVAERTTQLEQLSRLDGLTGLTNQYTFYEHLKREISICERHQEELTLIYFDLNNFKNINDTEGHQEGDLILTEVAKAMLMSIREVDVGSRYGGDEFCIILPRTSQEMALDVMQRIIIQFKKLHHKGVTFSIGIASISPDSSIEADSLVKQADALMYQSKERARLDNDFHITGSNDKFLPKQQESTQVKSA